MWNGRRSFPSMTWPSLRGTYARLVIYTQIRTSPDGRESKLCRSEPSARFSARTRPFVGSCRRDRAVCQKHPVMKAFRCSTARSPIRFTAPESLRWDYGFCEAGLVRPNDPSFRREQVSAGPVTNQVTTAPGNLGRNATQPDTAIRLACGNPTRYDVIRRIRHAW